MSRWPLRWHRRDRRERRRALQVQLPGGTNEESPARSSSRLRLRFARCFRKTRAETPSRRTRYRIAHPKTDGRSTCEADNFPSDQCSNFPSDQCRWCAERTSWPLRARPGIAILDNGSSRLYRLSLVRLSLVGLGMVAIRVVGESAPESVIASHPGRGGRSRRRFGSVPG